MTNEELWGLKNRVIDTMLVVHGIHHTFGWLRGTYLTPCSEEVEVNILNKTLAELENAQSKMLDTVRAGL